MTTIQRALSGLAIACASFCATNLAHANTYQVDYLGQNLKTDNPTIEAHLFLTTAGDASTWQPVTGISGTIQGASVTGLLPTNSFSGNDNLFSTGNGYFTYPGLAFIDSTNTPWNIYNSGRIMSGNNDYAQGGLTQVAAVPEPETYAMLMAGMGVLGAMGRRQKKQARRAALAA